MKKALSLALIFLLIAFCGCGAAVIYPEETTINSWMKAHTEGYVQLSPSSRMVLYQQEEGYKLRIDTGSDMVPKLTVDNDATNTVTQETSLLTVTSGTTLYGKANHTNSVFDPYRNSYTRAMQVWKKDDTTFRIFFWLYGTATDFYPIPQLLTEEQYNEMVRIVTDYTAEKKAEAEAAGDTPVNYTGDFINIYKSYYVSDMAKNPNGALFYQYNGKSSSYFSEYRVLFAQLGLSEQDWRKSFEELGYTGQKLNMMIQYCDVTVSDTGVSLTLQTKDAYLSNLLKSFDPVFTYSFCPALALREDLTVTVN